MQDIFGILLLFTGAASGLLFHDPAVCRFTESNQCYVALGQRLHLQMPQEDGFNLDFIDKTSTPGVILRYRKAQSNPTPKSPRWQFVNDNKTMILTSADRSDSGTYKLELIDASGNNKGNYILQLNIEAMVSSVETSYSCLFLEVKKVYCSAYGDNLRFNWTSKLNTQLENKNRTLVVNKNSNGNVTCHVENHVSRSNSSIELQSCPDSTPIILSVVCVLLIVLAVLAFYIYKKKQGLRNIEAASQDGKELVYSQVTHLPAVGAETRPSASRAQVEEVAYATVVTHPSQRNLKNKEDEVQYGELVFNTPDKNKCELPEVREECVYSQVQHGH